MATKIVNVNDEMTDKEWLELATNPVRDGLEEPHGCFASDAVMIFNTSGDKPCTCSRHDVHEKINENVNKCKNAKHLFSIDIRRLIDALAIMDGWDEHVNVYSEGKNKPVIIQSSSGRYTAIIMPLDANSVGAKLELHNLREAINE